MVSRLLPGKAGVPGPKSERPAVDIACFDSSGETGSVPQRVFRISLTVSNISRHVCPQAPVPELCQNPIHLVCRELLFERKQLPQIVDNWHFRMKLIERL